MPVSKSLAPIFLTLTAFAYLVLHGPAAQQGVKDARPLCEVTGNPYRIQYVAYGGKVVNFILCILNSFFAKLLTQPEGRDFTAYFLLSWPLFVVLPFLEAARPGRSIVLAFPTLFALLGQLRGAGLVMPVYFLLFVIGRSDVPVESHIDVERTLVSSLVGFAFPSARMFFDLSPSALGMFQVFPLFVAGAGSLYNILARGTAPNSPPAPRRAYLGAQAAYAICAVASTAGHFIYAVPRVLDGGLPELATFILPSYSFPFALGAGQIRVAPNLSEGVIDFLRWDQVCVAAATILGALFVADTPVDVLAFIATSVVAGPGTGCALLFALRESRIEQRRLAAKQAKKD